MSKHVLTDKAIRAFSATANPGDKLTDGEGLHIFIQKSRQPTWRIRYRFCKKERIYTVGEYPRISLKDARIECQRIHQLLDKGLDPVAQRRLEVASIQEQQVETLSDTAAAWFKKQQPSWSEVHYKKSWRAYERDIDPEIGKLPIASVTAPMVFAPLERVWKRGAQETTFRILQHLVCIFQYAQAKGLCKDNPAEPVYQLLPKRESFGHMNAILSPVELRQILQKADQARLSPTVRLAHRLCAFTAVRISNVVEAKWSEFDLDSEQPVWTIPRYKMKVRNRIVDHRVPLCAPLLDELKKWKSLVGGDGDAYLFPSSTTATGHICREAVEKAYRVTLRLGSRHSPHSWRSALSTLAKDHGFASDVVELALDHVHDNKTALAYDRGERFNQRVELFSWWSALLSGTEIS